MNPRAFTLVELLIVVVILAVLTVGLASNFSQANLKADYDDQMGTLVGIIEKARDYSLANYLVDDSEPAEYYMLIIKKKSFSLKAIGSDGGAETLESFTFDTRFVTDSTSTTNVYYFPPYGEVCFSTDCSDSTTEIDFTFSDTTGTYSKTVTISRYGGYPEVE